MKKNTSSFNRSSSQRLTKKGDGKESKRIKRVSASSKYIDISEKSCQEGSAG